VGRTLRIVVADDHPSIRENLRYLLNAEPGLLVVAAGKNGSDALRQVRELSPDVLVVDVDMPDLSGLQVAETLRAEGAAVGIVLYTLDSEACVQAREMGIEGCVTKDAPPATLIDAIRAAADVVTPQVK
jgi:DNA-binding NarL/FixJ family response regulator